MNAVRAFIGLGSNLGDRLDHLRRAVTALSKTAGIEVRGASSVYETDPVGPRQPDFLNAVVEIRTDLGPRELLEELKRIERDCGRTDGPKWGPREVDLDLLLYGSRVLHDPDLYVPHPEIASRAFVLVPLAELASDVNFPGLGKVKDLLDRVDPSGVRRSDASDALGV